MAPSAYLKLYSSGVLRERADEALRVLHHCQLCPRKCNVNRLEDKVGLCQTGSMALVASYGPHFGEEAPLVGVNGSGTIFFAGCNLLCCFCQNADISHSVAHASTVAPQQLAEIMLELQHTGCHNINLVTPSHIVPQFLQALLLAVDQGLTLPIVYNTSGYDTVETLQLLDGIIDIYMPDIKFWNAETATRYAKAPDYPKIVRKAVREMYRQVGNLVVDEQGQAVRGLLVRHLLMPGLDEETNAILKFLADSVSLDTYINIMDQYHPSGNANQYPELMRSLATDARATACQYARSLGLHRIDERDLAGLLQRIASLQQ
ncbi:radical SAM protein [Desulfogranum japonicum]|uniref:radical SAM protein n=1 Tax=Desulfogranum japonicum TaxID=231447 RepID=UPI0003FF2690|nr:radical SAM protein [Desulfogranum japonicum]